VVLTLPKESEAGAVGALTATGLAQLLLPTEMNPADFQLCDGFGFYKFCLTGFGLDNLA